jgi:16S rRNA (cytosine967-C5)-methyltransferase
VSQQAEKTTEKTSMTPRLKAILDLSVFENADKGVKNHVLKAPDTPLNAWSKQDQGFYHALVQTTLRFWATESALIETLTAHPLKSTQPLLRTVIRVGLAQLMAMPHLPEFAVVHDTVDCVKALVKRKKLGPKAVGFANALLQRYLREKDVFQDKKQSDDLAERLLYKAGWPMWWTQKLLAHYSPDIPGHMLDAMAEASMTPQPMTLRVNQLQTNLEAFETALTEHQIGFKRLISPTLNPDGAYPLIQLTDWVGSPTQLPGFEAGWFVVQDAASAWAAYQADVQPGEIVVDCCAAPGMKTAILAECLWKADDSSTRSTGQLLALEPNPERFKRLQDNLKRLQLAEHVTCLQREIEGEALPAPFHQADCVMVDAPCSGMGTLRKHPELLIHRANTDWDHYPKTQGHLLELASAWVKPGGRLVYSTCSILPEENEQVIAKFLAPFTKATPTPWEILQQTTRPIDETGDGFFLCVLRKIT